MSMIGDLLMRMAGHKPAPQQPQAGPVVPTGQTQQSYREYAMDAMMKGQQPLPLPQWQAQQQQPAPPPPQ